MLSKTSFEINKRWYFNVPRDKLCLSSFNSNHVWYGAFSSFNVLIGVRAYTSNESFLAFIIVSEGKLQWVSMEDELLNLVEWKPIRVVAKLGKVCVLLISILKK